MTAAQYAPKVMQAGLDLGISQKGIVIGFATVFVESNWLNYANSKVPASMSIPHDAVGSDGYSCGLFQQQVVDSGNGWWWGDAATCMDPYKSAQLFFQRLKANTNYNSDTNTPGSYAQAIQQSAYPDRYDQRMNDAQNLYNSLSGGETPVSSTSSACDTSYNEYARWCDNNQDRSGTTADLWLIHTQEGGGGDNAADELASFLISTEGGANPVSYHYTISQASDGGVTVCDVVDTDYASWSVGNSNNRSINLCFAGSSASWSRTQWMQQSNAIDVAAYLCVQDCVKYGINPKVIAPPYSSPPPGVSDHRYCTQYLKDGNTHTDVGDNFPWDVFAAAVTKYAGGIPTTPPVIPPPTPSTDFNTWLEYASELDLLRYIAAQLGPGDPSWTSTDAAKDTLRDFVWKNVATAAAKKKAKANGA